MSLVVGPTFANSMPKAPVPIFQTASYTACSRRLRVVLVFHEFGGICRKVTNHLKSERFLRLVIAANCQSGDEESDLKLPRFILNPSFSGKHL